MTMKAKCMAIALAIAGALALPADAQVVRENGAKSIAGVLYTLPSPQVASAEWTFVTSGAMVLFASLDAEIYRQMGTHDHLVADGTLAGAAAGGEDDGGPTLFKLVVTDPSGNVVCTAERPAPPPGWQRDPRMACYLPPLLTRQTPIYRLRVELKAPEGEHMVQPYYPFLLNVSLRRIASPGTDIGTAFIQSGF